MQDAPERSEKIALRLSAAAGAQIAFSSTTEVTGTVTQSDARMEMSTYEEQDYQIVVEKELAGGELELAVRFGRTVGSLKSPMGECEFDTDEPELPYPPVFAHQVLSAQARAGKTFKARVASNAEVRQVTGYNDIYRTAKQLEHLQSFTAAKTDQDGAQDLQTRLCRLPQIQIEPKSSWELHLPYRVDGNVVEFLLQYTVVRASAQEVTIAFAGASPQVTVLPTPAKPSSDTSIDARPASPSGSLKVKDATLKGTAVVSRIDGFPLRQTTEMSISYTYAEVVPGAGAPTTSMTISETVQRSPQMAETGSRSK
ncbi:MAG: hypothetical protein ABL998_08045 [Planctomycetota bacterium]